MFILKLEDIDKKIFNILNMGFNTKERNEKIRQLEKQGMEIIIIESDTDKTIFPDWFLSSFNDLNESNNLKELFFFNLKNELNIFNNKNTILRNKENNEIYYINRTGFKKFAITDNQVTLKNECSKYYYQFRNEKNKINIKEYKNNHLISNSFIKDDNLYYESYYPNGKIRAKVEKVENDLFNYRKQNYSLNGDIKKVCYFQENKNNKQDLLRNDKYIIEDDTLKIFKGNIKGKNIDEELKEMVCSIKNITEKELYLLELNYNDS